MPLPVRRVQEVVEEPDDAVVVLQRDPLVKAVEHLGLVLAEEDGGKSAKQQGYVSNKKNSSKNMLLLRQQIFCLLDKFQSYSQTTLLISRKQ